jgi:hypothetical protein
MLAKPVAVLCWSEYAYYCGRSMEGLFGRRALLQPWLAIRAVVSQKFLGGTIY